MLRTRTFAMCFPALGWGLALSLLCGLVQADPLPGRDVLKFSQRPLDGLLIPNDDGTVGQYWGHDELSTAHFIDDGTTPPVYNGVYMADDFADHFDSPVVHIKWWGSYMGQTPDTMPVDKFLISFESDVPVQPGNDFSHPGDVLSSQIVTAGALSPGSGTFTEKFISPGDPAVGEALYEYNAELNLGQEFFQKPDTVYWLKIVALVDIPAGTDPSTAPRWGWHDRDYSIMDPLASMPPAVVPGEHIEGMVGSAASPVDVWHFQDDAVTGQLTVEFPTPDLGPFVTQSSYQPTLYVDGVDGPGLVDVPGIGKYSKDLAFELYTVRVPEPASIALACLGMLFVGFCALRRGQSGLVAGPAGAQAARRSAAAGGQEDTGPTGRHGRLLVAHWKGGRTVFSLAGAASACLGVLSLGLAWTLPAGPAQADPLPGRDLLKFSQRPLDGVAIEGVTYFGHDELSTANLTDLGAGQLGYVGQFMADDFADTFDTPVVHVKWWGSYLGLQPGETPQPVDQFLIAFESDVPPGVDQPFSHPGNVMSAQIVDRGALATGSGTFTETLVNGGDPTTNEALYEYNAELHTGLEFPEQPNKVYWLKIVALVDPNDPTGVPARWGWHDRDYTIMDPLAAPVAPGEFVEGSVGSTGVDVWHFQDDAVSGDLTVVPGVTPDGGLGVFQNPDTYKATTYLDFIDGPAADLSTGVAGIGGLSKDLAFELYTVRVPEPASIGLACLGMLFVGMCALRRRRSES